MVAPLDPVVVKPELSNLMLLPNYNRSVQILSIYIYILLKDILPADNVLCKKKSSAQDYTICNIVLYKWFQKRVRVENGEKWIKQLCLPQVLRTDALLKLP